MKKIVVLVFLLGFALIQGCAVYPPYGHHAAYNSYNYGYQPNRNQGWGGHHHGSGGGHGWNGGGNGWGGHHGWGGGYGRR